MKFIFTPHFPIVYTYSARQPPPSHVITGCSRRSGRGRPSPARRASTRRSAADCACARGRFPRALPREDTPGRHPPRPPRTARRRSSAAPPRAVRPKIGRAASSCTRAASGTSAAPAR
eukprot:4026069-Prymnesium_polylepis.2